MTAPIEQALANYLTAHLTGATPATCLAFTSAGNNPTGHASVVCQLSLPHSVGPLYDGILTVHVNTPAKVAGFDLGTHNALCAAVKRLLDWPATDEDAATLQTDLTAALADVGWGYDGRYFQMAQDKQNESQWQQSMQLLIGLTQL
jgi:hypothetical protein